MSQDSVIQPKQQRSQETQRRLLAALHTCLKEKFFEHISIKELSELAGVSVGTFYRRFRDKESLLPLLYQDFGNDLEQWVIQVEDKEFASLSDTLAMIAGEMYVFLMERKSVFRTLHLNSRLHSALLDSDKNVDRGQIYQRIADIILRFEKDITVENANQAVGVVVFTMINTLMDKVLYPTLTPATASELSGKAFADELPNLVLPYLKQ